MASYEDTILETLPFAEQLIYWCKSHSSFYKALKVIYSERFIHLGAIMTSYSPNHPDDEVIGVFAYDYKVKKPMFKQDFIINKGKQYKEFLIFTRNPGGSSKWVKDINDFYNTYGRGGYYVNAHHLTLEQLPKEFRSRGIEAIKLGEKMLKHGFTRPSQGQIDIIYRQIVAEKKGRWQTMQKLKG